MPAPTPHRTPLRRVSQGSLFRLSRSHAYPDAPHGLGFLEPVVTEFADETEALQANLEGLNNLNQSLATFNESFASWLYVMNMNALTVDWTQAPTETSFLLAKRRAEQDARAALEVMRAQSRISAMPKPDPVETGDRTAMTEGDTTYNIMANTTAVTASSRPSTSSRAATTTKAKKKLTKPKMTAKEKKERNVLLEKVISTMPLEFRGSDPVLRRNMESVIESLIDAAQQTAKITDLIRPDCNQARVNKCLIALVGRKVVKKDNSTGQVLYHWNGIG